MNPLLAFCERERDWAVDAAEALVRVESPTPDKAAADRCADEVVRLLTGVGGRVSRLARAEAGDHVLAEFGCGPSQVLLLGHYDTVWDIGTLAARPIRRDGDRLYGPGIFDMKAGLAIAALALRALAESDDSWPGRITMLVTSDEETGAATSRGLIEDEALRSRAVLVLEPALPGGALKTARKGCGEFRLRVDGLAAHAGIEPEKGASAVHELARQIVDIKAIQDLGLRPEQCLIVEDNENGIRAARASGAHVLEVAETTDVNLENILNKIAEINAQCGSKEKAQ